MTITPSALNRLGWLLAAILALFVVAAFAGIVRGGPLDPTSAPAPTLPQVEPRIPIRQPATFPIVISTSGSYVLTQDLIAGANNGITITASDVTLDLNGFTLRGANTGLVGIGASATISNVTVKNGTVRDWLGAGVALGGVDGGRYERLSLISNNGGGLITGKDSSITDCLATDNGGNGIQVTQPTASGSSIVSGCVVDGSVLDGIQVDYSVTVSGNTVTDSGADGIHVMQSGNRIDSNNVKPGLGKAINIAGANNLVVRNSIRGAQSDLNFVAGNSFGQFQTQGETIANPWANVGY